MRYAGDYTGESSSCDEEDSEGGADESREGKGGRATTENALQIQLPKVESAVVDWLVIFAIV